jgi:PA14 domain
LSNFYVLVSDAPFNSTDLTATINQAGVSNYYTAGPVGVAKEIGVYRSGRYVRVQLAGDNYLHLAEVEVRGGAIVSGCVASVPANRWKGEYFNNTTLTGSPAMAQDNGSSFLNFDFGTGSPGAACGLSADFFSARWTRTVNFGSGLYRFSATGDDGVRLYVDGQLKIDKWILQGPTTYTTDMELTAGDHEVKLEYFEGGGPGLALLFWRVVTVPNCLQNAPLIGAAPRTGAGESVTTTPASEAPKRCGQKSSD